MGKLILLFIFNLFCFILSGQLPNTDIWLLNIAYVNNNITFSVPVNITQRVGYDNQPAFASDNSFLLFTSVREKDHAEIYKYDLISKTITQQTFVNESVYSPTFYADGQHFSVVMVEIDEVQRLWQFAMYDDRPTVLLPDIDSLGYHCWINNDSVAWIKITEPPSLYIANTTTQLSRLLSKNVARGMIKAKDNSIYYLSRNSNKDDWQLRNSTNVSFNEENKLTLPASVQDFNLLFESNQLVYGLKSQIMVMDLTTGKTIVLYDLSVNNIKNISRIAISKNGRKMAFVAE